MLFGWERRFPHIWSLKSSEALKDAICSNLIKAESIEKWVIPVLWMIKYGTDACNRHAPSDTGADAHCRRWHTSEPDSQPRLTNKSGHYTGHFIPGFFKCFIHRILLPSMAGPGTQQATGPSFMKNLVARLANQSSLIPLSIIFFLYLKKKLSCRRRGMS